MSAIVTSSQAPRSLLSLPGVGQIVAKGTLVRTDGHARDVTGAAAGRSAGSEAAAAVRRQEFAADITANTVLVDALARLHVRPTAEGLDRIAVSAIQHAQAFAALVSAVTMASLTLGKSAGANKIAGDALQQFTQQSSTRATDMADMAYLMARVVLLSQQTEREQAMKALEESIKAAKQELAQAQQEREQLEQSGSKSGGKSSGIEAGGKTYSRSELEQRSHEPGLKGAVAKTKLAEFDSQRDRLDARIGALRDAIRAMEQQLSAQQLANQAQVQEVIFMLVEKAMALAQQPVGNKASSSTSAPTASRY